MNLLETIPEGNLTLDQENELATQKNEDALNALVMGNLRQAFFYARTCYPSLEEGELLGACYEGLLSAAKNFKPNRISFFGYAKAYVRGALCKTARARDVVRRGPRELEQLANPDPEEDEFFESLNKRRADLRWASAETSPAFDEIHLREIWQQIEPAFQTALNAEERMVIQLNFQGGLNLREIGDLLDLTRERIRQIKNKALRKIRARLTKEKSTIRE